MEKDHNQTLDISVIIQDKFTLENIAHLIDQIEL